MSTSAEGQDLSSWLWTCKATFPWKACQNKDGCFRRLPGLTVVGRRPEEGRKGADRPPGTRGESLPKALLKHHSRARPSAGHLRASGNKILTTSQELWDHRGAAFTTRLPRVEEACL